MGIVQKRAEEHLPGYSGLIKVRYVGEVESGELPASVYARVRYRYGKGMLPFYVDARELRRVLAWTEDGRKVFEVAKNGTGV